MNQSDMQFGKKKDVQQVEESIGKDTLNSTSNAECRILRRFWETKLPIVKEEREPENKPETTVLKMNPDWKDLSFMESLKKEDKDREMIFEPKPRLLRTFRGRVQKQPYKSLQTDIQSSSLSMQEESQPYFNHSRKVRELKRQNAFLLSDHQEQESQHGFETTTQMHSGNKQELINGGMDIKEKTQLSSMNSKDGSQLPPLPKSLGTRMNAEWKSKEGRLNLQPHSSFVSPTLVQENGGRKVKSSFVLSKEDFLKSYTLVPVVDLEEETMEMSGTMISKDSKTGKTLKRLISKDNMFSDIDEEEEFKILEELEREIEEERLKEIKETLLNLNKD